MKLTREAQRIIDLSQISEEQVTEKDRKEVNRDVEGPLHSKEASKRASVD